MKINASRPKEAGKRLVQAGRLAFHALGDNVRFWRFAALSPFDCSYEQLVARILYNVHALEKGLAQTADWRPGRGRKALRNLNDALAGYRGCGFEESAFAFMEGLSIIQRYEERHTEHQDAIAYLREVVDPAFLTAPLPSGFTGAGVKVVRSAEKTDNLAKSFYELSQARSSIRAFSGASIDHERVMRPLRNAERTPSVCNRQGWRVYWTTDKDLSAQVFKHQRGFSYPQMPEVLLAITVSRSSFISPVERNQAFIDGGLYAMSVLYGLEAEGLAAVPLNACLYARDRDAIHRLLKIDPSEEIIMFIAIGDLPAESVVPASDRRPTHEYLRVR